MSDTPIDAFTEVALRLQFVTQASLTEAINDAQRNRGVPLRDYLVANKHLTVDQARIVDLVASELQRLAADLTTSPSAGGDASITSAPLPVNCQETLIHSSGTTNASLATLDRSDRFRLMRLHAQGGLGEVSVALDRDLSREVAVKRIQSRFADDQPTRLRFVREAEITGKLEHPNIVPVYALGVQADGRPYYAMRFIRGESLKDVVDRHYQTSYATDTDRNLAFRVLLKRFMDACNAIAYAHDRGFVHRDIKPANIMLGDYGETLVVDWGLAKELRECSLAAGAGEVVVESNAGSPDGSETRMGDIVGTPAFMSPEQAVGDIDRIGRLSDIYSLGATLYYVSTGRLAVSGDNPQAVLDCVRKGEIVPPSQSNTQVSSPLSAIIVKAMALDGRDRYPTATQLADDLEHLLADEPVSAHRETVFERTKRWARKNPALIAGLTAAILVGFVSLLVSSIVLQGKNYLLDSANGKLNDANRDLEAARQDADKKRSEAERARDKVRRALDTMTSELAGDALAGQEALSDEQKRFLESMLEQYQELAVDEAVDQKSRYDKATAATRVATTLSRLSRFPEALAAFENSDNAFRELVSESPTLEHCVGLAKSLDNHATCIEERAVMMSAGANREDIPPLLFEAAAALRPHQESLRSDPAYRQWASHMRGRVGEAKTYMGNVDGAIVDLTTAITEHKEMLQAPPVDAMPLRIRLISLHNDLSMTYFRARNGAMREQTALEAVALARDAVTKYPNDRRTLEQLEQSLTRLALACFDNGKTSEHRTLIEENSRIVRELASKYPVVASYQFSNASRLQIEGDVALREGRFADAASSHREAITITMKLVEQSPNDAYVRGGLARSYKQVACANLGLSKRAEAMECYQRAVEIYQESIESSPAVFLKVNMGNEICDFANQLRDQDPAASIEIYEQSAAILDPLHQTDWQGKSPGFIHVPRWGLAEAHELVGNFAAAAEQWKLAIGASPSFRHPMFRERRAIALSKAADHENAILAAAESEADNNQNPQVYVQLAKIHVRAGDHLVARRDECHDQAIKLFGMAVDKGYRDADALRADKQFESIASRVEFRELLNAMEKKEE